MSKTILIVEEEKMPMVFYKKLLERFDYKVIHCIDVDTCMKLINKGIQDLAVIIIDIMMPPGNVFSMEESEDGLITGILLYNKLREQFPKLPMIILTNVGDITTLSKIKENYYLRVAKKLDYPPMELKKLVDEVVALPINEGDGGNNLNAC